ncbi:MAG: excinuclease ABC subunit C, partial [Deltaproteobacteria bacterium]|nr:excinuclease ABC subunit C [Deltaproteobacteria bacterium]
KAASLPDLIIIDGGKGQLNICLKVLDELSIKDIDVIAIAKDKIGATGEKIYLPNVKDPVVLKRGSDIDLFLRKIRDEVHRFAIKYHKKLRKKGIVSVLEETKGIGKKKAKNLLVHFGSIDKIKEASIEEILKVKGMTMQVADKIKETLGS